MGKKIFTLFLILLLLTTILGVLLLYSSKHPEVMQTFYKRLVTGKPDASPEEAAPLPPPPDESSSDWPTFTNEKYRYRFTYDRQWFLDRPLEESKDDHVFLEGGAETDDNFEIRVIYRPYIVADAPRPETIDDLMTSFNPSLQAEKAVFGKLEIPAVFYSLDGAEDKIDDRYYILHKGEILAIGLTGSRSLETQGIFDRFLEEFEVF